MADAQLSVSVSANIQSFTQAMNQAANATTQTGNTVTTVTQNISRNVANLNRTNLSAFNASLAAGTLQYNRLGAASNSVSRDLARAATSTSRAGDALTNFGRIAQDAPFGFIAIQNNLNPLLESYQRLVRETGSASAAFRALGSSLLGPAGIGIALSVVSSAIVVYQQYQQRANKATENAKKVTDEYVKSLESVTAANLKGAQNAQKELTDLRLLYQAYQNTNLPLKARKEAYEALQQQYPDYFKNLKFEETASEATAAAYKSLTAEILATARARAASEKIAANEGRKLENEQKIVDLEKEQIKNQRALGKAQKRGTVSGGAGIVGVAGSSGLGLAEQQKINENLSLRRTLVSDSNKLTEENARLVGYVNTQLEKGGKIIDTNNEKRSKAKEQLKKDARTISNLTITSPRIDPGAGALAIPDLDLRGVTTGISQYILLMQKANESNDNFVKSVKNLATETLASGLSTAFSAIGQSLAEGTNAIDAFGSALLSAFAGFLSQLGQMFIKEGIAQIGYGIAKNLILPGSGANNITGGIGMIAAGGVISAIGGAAGAKRGKSSYQNVSQVRGFATGGYNLPSGVALVGEKGPELLNLPTGASIDNNNRTNRILASGNRENVVINGNFEIGLEKLYVRLEQTGKKMGRKV